MGSVRERLDRERRSQESPEQFIDTGTHRVALGAAGPTLSTRQREQLAADQSETVEASPHTRVGGTDFMSGNMTRVRDRQVMTEAMAPVLPRPKTPAEIAADEGLAEYNRRQEAKAREEKARLDKLAARRQQEVDAQRKAQTAFLESLILREASDLTEDEAQLFWTRLATADKMLDVEFAAIVAESIRMKRV
jgi:hypothetical protein